MSFKESYKKDYENIKTDEAFKKQLSEKMKAVPKTKIHAGVYAVAALAAVIAVVLGLRSFTPAEEQSGIIQEQGDTVTTISTATGSFMQEKWYAGAENDEEIWDKFRELMGGEDIATLYCGSSEQLGDGDILSDTEAEELSQKLASAVLCEEKELSGEISFCMAVFGDGKIVKFRISENGEVQLNDTETICKFE